MFSGGVFGVKKPTLEKVKRLTAIVTQVIAPS